VLEDMLGLNPTPPKFVKTYGVVGQVEAEVVEGRPLSVVVVNDARAGIARLDTEAEIADLGPEVVAWPEARMHLVLIGPGRGLEFGAARGRRPFFAFCTGRQFRLS